MNKYMAYQREYRERHKEKYRQYARQWYQDHKEHCKVRHRLYQRSGKHKKTLKKWRLKNRDRLAAMMRRARQKIRLEAIAHYGGKCACCGESNEVFLAFDHKNGGGTKQRKAKQVSTGGVLGWQLKKKGWPEEFQVLCHNCNWAKWRLGKCPHQS